MPGVGYAGIDGVVIAGSAGHRHPQHVDAAHHGHHVRHGLAVAGNLEIRMKRWTFVEPTL